MAKSPATRFVLNRLNWTRVGRDHFERRTGFVRVASFDTADAAHAELWRRELAARGKINPFACGPPVHSQTTLPEPIFRDWLLDRGVTPPKPGATRRQWETWWKAAQKKWSADTRLAVWDGLDRVRFYEVVERPAATVVYAVAQLAWVYNDEGFDASVGDMILQAYRSRANAEAECARQNEADRPEWIASVGDFELDPGDDFRVMEVSNRESDRGTGPDWPPPWPGPAIRRMADVPFYEVIELELEGGT